jgi:hypothetical protein
MNRKNIIILIIILILVLGLGFILSNKENPSTDAQDDKKINVSEEITEIDTSDWKVFEATWAGIRYKYPKKCERQGVSPENPAEVLGCSSEFMYYEPLNDTDNPYRKNLNDLFSRDIKEIAEIYYDLNKNDSNPNVPKDRIIGELERKDINGYEAYQFILDWGFYKLNSQDYLETSNGMSLDGLSKLVFITNGDKKMLIRIKCNDPIFEMILSTFEFID